jgi:hypothetical protein
MHYVHLALLKNYEQSETVIVLANTLFHTTNVDKLISRFEWGQDVNVIGVKLQVRQCSPIRKVTFPSREAN